MASLASSLTNMSHRFHNRTMRNPPLKTEETLTSAVFWHVPLNNAISRIMM